MATINNIDIDNDLYSQIMSLSIDEFTDVFFTKLNSNPDFAVDLTQKIVLLSNQLGKMWNLEHDVHGNPISGEEKTKVSTKDLTLFWEKVTILANLIRSRLPIEISEPKIAVGTLLNTHDVSQLVDLQIRINTKLLTYYWGTELSLEKIKSLMAKTPNIDIIVLSVMGVNSKLNAFKEIKSIRKEFPNKIMIVGGAAWPLFELLKLDPNHSSLSAPYKNNQYLDLLSSVDSIKEFIKLEFNVIYCKTIDELLEIIENKINIKMAQVQE